STKKKQLALPASTPIEILDLIPEEWREDVTGEANRIFKQSDADTLRLCIEKVGILFIKALILLQI
ncbi:MAG: hypothetical protein HQK62_14840, partial [Desulfamplus sp.]|nr:hypothetical protein [Desulfamplus sp.]